MWKKLGIAASVLGIDAWSIYSVIMSFKKDGLEIVGKMTLHPPFFVLIACLVIPPSVVLVLALFWTNIRKLMPSSRFHDLKPEIASLARLIEVENPDLKPGKWSFEVGSSVRTLASRMKALGIKSPEANPEMWHVWLQRMHSWSETKNLKAARKWVEPRP